MHKLLRTSSFRLAMLGAVVFGLCMVAVASIVVFSVRESVHEQLRTRIANDAVQLMGDYHDDGIEELRHDIRERIKRQTSDRLYYSIISPDGRAIFDRLPFVAEAGWRTDVLAGGEQLVLHSYPLEDGYWLLVGADLHTLTTLESALRHTFVWVFIVVAVLSLLAGVVLSRRFLKQVAHLQHSAERIGRDSIDQRIALRGVDDAFEALAITINHMLDRIATLMHDVRYVSTSIAHDMRTPLGRLRQQLEALEVSTGEPATRAQAEACIAQLDATLATFSALLKIAEIESQPAAHTAPVDLAALCAQLAESYQPVAEERSQQLQLAIDDAVPAVMGDKALLTQLIVNLIENAMHHTPAGTVITLAVAVEGGRVTLSVADNGPGVAPDARENIFKPFYKGDSSRSGGGSGLGLALVAAIAGRHRATLQVQDAAPGLRIACRFP